jgi:hypothetical protein
VADLSKTLWTTILSHLTNATKMKEIKVWVNNRTVYDMEVFNYIFYRDKNTRNVYVLPYSYCRLDTQFLSKYKLIDKIPLTHTYYLHYSGIKPFEGFSTTRLCLDNHYDRLHLEFWRLAKQYCHGAYWQSNISIFH